MDNYKKYAINDIYLNSNKNYLDNADIYYINHNVINNGIEISNKISPINNAHTITNSVIDYGSSNGPYPYKNDNDYYQLMNIYDNTYINNNYKLISAKDIDYENAYLKYTYQISEYKNPITYDNLSIKNITNDDGTTSQEIEVENLTTDTYIFNREITPYINNTYDLLNIIDYLCNRINCFYFLLNNIKSQYNIINSITQPTT